MSFTWLSRLDCSPLQKHLFMRRLQFVVSNFETLYNASAQEAPSLDQTSLYIALDPDLQALSKQLNDAKSRFDQMRAIHAVGDPMLDMALWQLEACESSFETRLLELKTDKRLNETVDKMVNGDNEAAAEQTVVFIPSRKRERQSNGWAIMLALMMLAGISPFCAPARSHHYRPSVA